MPTLEFTKPQQVRFATRVREWRTSRGFTRAEMARLLGVSVTAVGQIEGAYRPTVGVVLAFAELVREWEDREAVHTPDRW